MNDRSFKFKYLFAAMGSVAGSSGRDKELLKAGKNKIFLDVGNKLCRGIIDHHHIKDGISLEGSRYKSTAGILSVCPSFLLDNLDEERREIEIVVHKAPDFDCFASVYLAKELITHRKFPENYELLVEYVEKIDSGSMKIDSNQLNAPFLIAHAIDEVIRRREPSMDWDALNAAMLDRGIQLVDYVMKRLAELDERCRSIYSPALISCGSGFQEEIEFINCDYEKYVQDKRTCESMEIRLPLKDTSKNYSKMVDALLWSKVPTCLLHKYWARTDRESPSKEGYVFTFIPQIKEKTMFKGIELDKNRVIISVDPSSNVCLKGLGKYLEMAECEKEEALLRDLKRQRRDYQGKRYSDEEWCTNNNPWYDGRSHEFTIVDSPGEVQSLLTIEEIKEIALNFESPKLKEGTVRYLFSFSFDPKAYPGLCSHPGNSGEEFDDERVNYFLPYIQKYLYGRSQGCDNLPHSIHFPLEGHRAIAAKGTGCLEILDSEPKEGISADVKKGYIKLFRYGVGFLVLEATICGGERFVKEIISFNKKVDKERHKIFEAFSHGALAVQSTFVCDRLFTYTSLRLTEDKYHHEELREILFKLSNNIEWQDSLSHSKYAQDLLEKMFLKIEDYAYYGFSKSGGSFVAANDGGDAVKRRKTLSYLHTFETTDFDILLLALHQRNALMNFSNKLSLYEAGSSKNTIDSLRNKFLNFTTQSWFSQITEDELGSEKYKRWQSIFENQILYEEVDKQITEVDEYNQSRLSKRIELISAVTLPLAIISSLLGMNIFTTTGAYKIPSGYITLISIALWIVSSYAIYRSLKKD